MGSLTASASGRASCQTGTSFGLLAVFHSTLCLFCFVAAAVVAGALAAVAAELVLGTASESPSVLPLSSLLLLMLLSSPGVKKKSHY